MESGLEFPSSPHRSPTVRTALFADTRPAEIDRTVLAIQEAPLVPFEELEFDLTLSPREFEYAPGPPSEPAPPKPKAPAKVVMRPFASATECELTVKVLRAYCERGIPASQLAGLDMLGALRMGL
jgi:hypothetical protein